MQRKKSTRRTTGARLDADRNRAKKRSHPVSARGEHVTAVVPGGFAGRVDRFAKARAVREANLAARRYAPKPLGAPIELTTDEAVNLYRVEKANAEPRTAAKIAEAKAAFQRLMSDLDVSRKGGRPRTKGIAGAMAQRSA